MNDRFTEPLSETDGEIHTVCVGRPFNVDFLAAARRGIHVHVYSNNVDDVYRTIAGSLSVRAARRSAPCSTGYLHVHEPLQPAGSGWARGPGDEGAMGPGVLALRRRLVVHRHAVRRGTRSTIAPRSRTGLERTSWPASR